MTVEQLFKTTISSLTPALGEREARSAARIIFEDIRGLSQTDIVIHGDRTVEDFTVIHINGIVNKIVNGMPVQYAVGTARFCGLNFNVTPDVLIPRPETEGLVDYIISDYKDCTDLKILDCGTGSGCIAITLARSLPFAMVDAIDISDEALKIARENASNLKVNVNFKKSDILALKAENAPIYDIIVSNPPYIAWSEEAEMDKRVKSHEPIKALFVNDNDPLVFYRSIAEYAQTALKPGGRLYFEINPRFADDMKTMLETKGYANVDISRDYIGRYRYATAVKPQK